MKKGVKDCKGYNFEDSAFISTFFGKIIWKSHNIVLDKLSFPVFYGQGVQVFVHQTGPMATCLDSFTVSGCNRRCWVWV